MLVRPIFTVPTQKNNKYYNINNNKDTL